MHDIFISYSRKDQALVTEFCDRLVDLGYSVWIDKDGIESGDAFKKVIVNAIKESRLVVFFSSENSNASLWTAKEVGVAIMQGVPIIPVKLDRSSYNDDVLFDLVNLDYTDYSSVRERGLQMERFLQSVQNKIPLTGASSKNPEPSHSGRPVAKKADKTPGRFLAMDEFEHLNRKRIGTVALKALYSLLYLGAVLLVLSFLFFNPSKDAPEAVENGGILLLLLVLLGGTGVYFIWCPRRFRGKFHRECRDIEQESGPFRIVRGPDDRYGLCRVKGGRIRKILGFDYQSACRISPALFIFQDGNGRYALYHVSRKWLTGFEFDRYSLDDDIISLEKDGTLVYYSTQGFRQNI